MALARNLEGKWTEHGRAWTSCNIGGGTVYYGAASFRLREVDFDASSFFETDLDLRWPISYADLAPFYNRVEERLRVARGWRDDPTAPPMPPGLPSHAPSVPGARLRDGARSLGLTPFPTPLAINTVADGKRGLCTRCSGCIDWPCPTGAKVDAATAWLADLGNETRFVLLDRIRAVRLTAERTSTVEAVECVDLAFSVRRRFHARCFVLAANAVQSSALLLRSTSRGAPAGLGNEHGMVGRGLCLKLSEYVAGYACGEPCLLPEALNGPFSTVSVTDYYARLDDDRQMGGLIYESKPATAAYPPSERLYLRLEVLLADTPRRRNRVRLSDRADSHGVPLVVLDYRTTGQDRRRLASLTSKASDIVAASGARDVQSIDSEYYLGSGHLHGGCRSGVDPRDSVVDPTGRVHSLQNVFVADGGFMPYPGGVNPTLTIQANALRIADYVVDAGRRA
jgi:choline dehydrogenase-like flavoprotein